MISDLSGLPIGLLAAVQAAYAVPPRAYHDFGHVGDVLARADEVAAGPGWRDPAAVRLAILYHDAVYEPARRDNEARSARLAREHLARWDTGVDPDRVAALVELTARHGRLGPDAVTVGGGIAPAPGQRPRALEEQVEVGLLGVADGAVALERLAPGEHGGVGRHGLGHRHVAPAVLVAGGQRPRRPAHHRPDRD